jgi:hypothetical protein
MILPDLVFDMAETKLNAGWAGEQTHTMTRGFLMRMDVYSKTSIATRQI